MNNFVIDKVVWHLKVQGNTETPAHIRERFWFVARFLQEHGLTKRQLVASEQEIGDDFALVSEDLTDRGLELMKHSYDKWLKRVDKGMPPSDTSILENELKKL